MARLIDTILQRQGNATPPQASQYSESQPEVPLSAMTGIPSPVRAAIQAGSKVGSMGAAPIPTTAQPIENIGMSLPKSKWDLALGAAAALPVGRVMKSIIKEPTLANGMKRLYRGELAGSSPTGELEGNWWTPSREHAEDVALNHHAYGDKANLMYLDIPESNLSRYDAFYNPLARNLIGPGETPYILPRELSGMKRKLATAGQLSNRNK